MSSYEDIRDWIQEGPRSVAQSALRTAFELAEQGDVYVLDAPSISSWGQAPTLDLELSSSKVWGGRVPGSLESIFPRTITVTRAEDGGTGLLLTSQSGARQVDDKEASVALGLAPDEWQRLRAAVETALDQLAVGGVWPVDRGTDLRFTSRDVVAEKYAAAVERGSQQAEARLHELGVDPAEFAAGRSTIPDEVTATLRREGMEATDRGQNSIGYLAGVGDLEAQLENLAGHPWDQGAARQLVLEQIDVQVQEAARLRAGDEAASRTAGDELTTAISYQEIEADSASAQRVWAVVEDVSRHSVHPRDAAATPALAGLRAVRRENAWTAVTIVAGDRATDVSVYEASTPGTPTAKDRLLGLAPASSPATVAHDAAQHREMSR